MLQITVRDDYSEFYDELKLTYEDEIHVSEGDALDGAVEIVIELLKIATPIVTIIITKLFEHKKTQGNLLRIEIVNDGVIVLDETNIRTEEELAEYLKKIKQRLDR